MLKAVPFIEATAISSVPGAGALWVTLEGSNHGEMWGGSSGRPRELLWTVAATVVQNP